MNVSSDEVQTMGFFIIWFDAKNDLRVSHAPRYVH